MVLVHCCLLRLQVCMMLDNQVFLFWKVKNISSFNHSVSLFGILRISPFVNHKGKDVNSDCLADQWDERSVLGHAQIHKGRLKGDDSEINTAQTPKRFDKHLAHLEKIRKTFTDSIPNKSLNSRACLVGCC